MSVTNNVLTQHKLSSPTAISGSKKNERIIYSEIIRNGKKGIFLNLNSCTPPYKSALVKFNERNMYIYINYTEELELLLTDVVDKMGDDDREILEEKFLLYSVLNKYKEDGYIKAKIDMLNFGESFFQQPTEGKNGKKELKNLPYEDFQYDAITEGIFSLKISGVWRRENTSEAGISIRVLAVLVKSFHNITQDEEYEEESVKNLLNSRAIGA